MPIRYLSLLEGIVLEVIFGHFKSFMLKNRLFTVYLNFTMSGNCFLVIVKNLGGKISEPNFVFLKQKFEM